MYLSGKTRGLNLALGGFEAGKLHSEIFKFRSTKLYKFKKNCAAFQLFETYCWKINGKIRKYMCNNLLHLEFELDAEQADPMQQEYKTFLKLLLKLLTAAHLIFGFFLW